MKGTRLLVTRPEPQASDWADRLCARGVDAVALPLMAILPAEEPQRVAAAWHALPGLQGVMFVSPGAVRAFADARPAGAAWPASVWAAAPGPGTARLLAGLGAVEVLAPGADAEQFDTDTLWTQIGGRDWRGQRILIVHGGAGREDLALRWSRAGAQVDKLQAYRRGAAGWGDAQARILAGAQQDPQAHRWLFSSSEAILRLLDRAPGPWAGHRALCTHPAIAERARRAGFGQVLACKPDIDAIIVSLSQDHGNA